MGGWRPWMFRVGARLNVGYYVHVLDQRRSTCGGHTVTIVCCLLRAIRLRHWWRTGRYRVGRKVCSPRSILTCTIPAVDMACCLKLRSSANVGNPCSNEYSRLCRRPTPSLQPVAHNCDTSQSARPKLTRCAIPVLPLHNGFKRNLHKPINSEVGHTEAAVTSVWISLDAVDGQNATAEATCVSKLRTLRRAGSCSRCGCRRDWLLWCRTPEAGVFLFA